MKPMRLAIASGKGGTGKTTLATNLAAVLAERENPVAYLDCDVEEPNGHLFLRPQLEKSVPVTIAVPEVDESLCNYCGACGKACRFSAILALKNKVLTFPKLCHGCGGCMLACPEEAIREVPRPIGIVESGASGPLRFVHGKLDIGEAMSPPLIRAVISAAPENHTLVLDAPPGTSCPVIETVKTADVVLLVTEPTPFGLNDLELAVETIRLLGLPFGVAVNRAGVGDRAVYDYCAREDIPLLFELPDDRRIATAYSRGELAIKALPELKPLFFDLADKLGKLATGPRPEARPVKEQQTEGYTSSALPSEQLPAEARQTACEIVIISGKGGTGKTSVTASFAALAGKVVVADCDVDAADLHLVLNPEVRERRSFSGGQEAWIDPNLCDSCGLCAEHCRFDAILPNQGDHPDSFLIDPISCESCGVCVDVCPAKAVTMYPSVDGEWFISETSHGPMVHARLGIAKENSGKLVTLVRREARATAALRGLDLILSDGSPGIGCPVIASITGARMALVVSEPTLSGLHDLERVVELTRHFDVKTVVAINKADINLDMSAKIELAAESLGIPVLGRIRYDVEVTHAQVAHKAVVEHCDGPAAEDIRNLWKKVLETLA
ncbi:MAG TPA: P-loop NTPase [Myxococcota bacterium]|nr:P-loop NTPase [Myxococcota bacterium]